MRYFCGVFLLVMAAQPVCYSNGGAAREITALDLTTPPGQTRGVPGIRGGGRSGEPIAGPYKLPLSPSAAQIVRSGNDVNVLEFLLINSSDRPFALPIGRENVTLHADGKRERRTFLWALNVIEGDDISTVVASVTFSSVDVPESTVRLAPGSSLKVLLPLRDLPAHSAASGRTQILVAVQEYRIDDSRYFVDSMSDWIRSREPISFE